MMGLGTIGPKTLLQYDRSERWWVERRVTVKERALRSRSAEWTGADVTDRGEVQLESASV